MKQNVQNKSDIKYKMSEINVVLILWNNDKDEIFLNNVFHNVFYNVFYNVLHDVFSYSFQINIPHSSLIIFLPVY